MLKKMSMLSLTVIFVLPLEGDLRQDRFACVMARESDEGDLIQATRGEGASARREHKSISAVFLSCLALVTIRKSRKQGI